MTGISIGSTAITGVYVGSTLATGVYFGSTKIWPTTAGITFVAACTPASGVGDTSLNLGLPASAQAGDIVIASLMDNGSGASYTPPSGALTPVSTSFSDTAGGGGVPVQVRGYVVRLTSADISNGYLAFTLVNALATDIHGLVFRGVSDTELDVAAGVAVSTGAATTPVTFSAPGITTVTDGCMRVAVALVLPANASEDITTPAGYTVGDIGLDNGGQLQQLAYSTQPTHGATGDVSWTEGASGDTGAGWCGFLIALRPANPAITLSATFPSNLHVGDTGSFDITATRVDGATGSLTIIASGLPDGMTLGATTDNGGGTFTATVDYDLTTVEDVTATFSATGGSVAATPLAHEFNVQASASGPTVRGGNSADGTITSLALPAGCQAGDTAWVAGDGNHANNFSLFNSSTVLALTEFTTLGGGKGLALLKYTLTSADITNGSIPVQSSMNVTGVTVTSPAVVDAQSALATKQQSDTPTPDLLASGVTTTSDNEVLLFVGAIRSVGTASGTFTPQEGFTATVADNLSGNGLIMACMTQAAAGPSGDVECTFNNNNYCGWGALLVALKSA